MRWRIFHSKGNIYVKSVGMTECDAFKKLKKKKAINIRSYKSRKE